MTPELWLLARAALLALIILAVEFRAPIWKRVRSWRERRRSRMFRLLSPKVQRALVQTYGEHQAFPGPYRKKNLNQKTTELETCND